MPDPDHSLEASVERIRSLLAQWDTLRQPAQELARRKEHSVAHVVAVWGLSNNAHRQTALILPMLGQYGTEIAPMIRALWEAAIYSQWIALRGPEALPSFLNAGGRQRVTLLQTMRDAGWSGPIDDALAESEAELIPDTTLDAQAKRFEQVCLDFNGGSGLYAVYRFLSGLAHPGTGVIDQYVIRRPERAALLDDPREQAHAAWAWTVTTSLIWTAAAVNWVVKDDATRHFLKRTAREYGTGDRGDVPAGGVSPGHDRMGDHVEGAIV